MSVAINALINEAAIAVCVVSGLLFILQNLKKSYKILFAMMAFVVLLVPLPKFDSLDSVAFFDSFSVSGYIYALLGSPSVLLIALSVWSGLQILAKDVVNRMYKNLFGVKIFGKKFVPFLDIKSKVVIFVVCGIVYMEFLGGIFALSYYLPSLNWLNFYHLDVSVQVVCLWVFALLAFFISARFGVGIVCALFAYYCKILGDFLAWDYCFDFVLWLWCGGSVICYIIVQGCKNFKNKKHKKP